VPTKKMPDNFVEPMRELHQVQIDLLFQEKIKGKPVRRFHKRKLGLIEAVYKQDKDLLMCWAEVSIHSHLHKKFI
jgi:hypothetical protein